MYTYTFIMEFRGGTYISQVNATSLKQSLHKWARELTIKEIKYFGNESQTELLEIISDDDTIPITGLINVWCLSLSLKVGFMLVNIVQTVNKRRLQN